MPQDCTKHFPNSDCWNLGLFTFENYHLSHQAHHSEKKQHIIDLVQVQASSCPVHGQITPHSYWFLSLCLTAASISAAFPPRQSFTQPSDCELSTPLLTTPLLQKWVECKQELLGTVWGVLDSWTPEESSGKVQVKETCQQSNLPQALGNGSTNQVHCSK